MLGQEGAGRGGDGGVGKEEVRKWKCGCVRRWGMGTGNVCGANRDREGERCWGNGNRAVCGIRCAVGEQPG